MSGIKRVGVNLQPFEQQDLNVVTDALGCNASEAIRTGLKIAAEALKLNAGAGGELLVYAHPSDEEGNRTTRVYRVQILKQEVK